MIYKSSLQLSCIFIPLFYKLSVQYLQYDYISEDILSSNEANFIELKNAS